MAAAVHLPDVVRAIVPYDHTHIDGNFKPAVCVSSFSCFIGYSVTLPSLLLYVSTVSLSRIPLFLTKYTGN